MPSTKPDSPDFEASIERLETLIDQMETGDLSLEESLKTYENGVRLTRQCQQALTDAQLKVDALLAQHSDQVESDRDD